jgi:hypothetical protein
MNSCRIRQPRSRREEKFLGGGRGDEDVWMVTNSLNYLGPRQSKIGYQTGPRHHGHGSGSKDGSLPKAPVINNAKEPTEYFT